MTKTRKHIIDLLMNGHYLRLWRSVNGIPNYRVFDSSHNSVGSVSQKTVDKLDRFIDPKIKIWIIVKPGKIMLNLSMVRRLHGRSYLKQAYRKSKQLQ